MSELKAYGIRVIDGLIVESESGQLYIKSEADKVIAEKDAIIEKQEKEIKFMHQNCKHGEHCGTSCAQIHGELMQATIEIAELKERFLELQDTAIELDKKLTETRKQLRRHKYKRCLDKAELCHWKAGVFLYKKEKSDFYYRWYKRWLELAEKIKEHR